MSKIFLNDKDGWRKCPVCGSKLRVTQEYVGYETYFYPQCTNNICILYDIPHSTSRTEITVLIT